VPPGRPAPADLGRAGEELAAQWYSARGYEILARNWRSAGGELDLVAGRGRMVAVVEVKARSDDRFGAPVEAVVASKQARIRRLAAAWLRESGLKGRRVRFDVVSVLAGVVEVLEDAF
jgi:putative endonuclease